MEDIIIVGAGGFGRELKAWAEQSFDMGTSYRFKGFLDDNPNALDGYNYPIGVIGSIKDYQPESNERLIFGIGIPDIKKTMIESLKAKGAQFLTLIHPTVTVGSNVDIGEGVIACPNAILSSDSTIGAFSVVNFCSTVSHDVTVGPYCQLSSHCDLTGFVTLGESVFLGSHACVHPGISIGDRAVIGAGTVCMRNVKADTTVFGVPARPQPRSE